VAPNLSLKPKPPSSDWRVMRGGGFWDDADVTSVAFRIRGNPGNAFPDQGFRVLSGVGPTLEDVRHRQTVFCAREHGESAGQAKSRQAVGDVSARRSYP